MPEALSLQRERERVLAVERLALLQTPAEERFDRITRIALRLLAVPFATLTLISGSEWFVKSAQGWPLTSGRRGDSFSTHTVARAATFVVEDALLDARFAQNPHVTGAPFVRAYVGEPLWQGGACVGALAVIDTAPRVFAAGDLQVLKDLAALVESEFERGRAGPLTDRVL